MSEIARLPLFDGDDTAVPYQGKTVEARAASRSGAVHALTMRKAKTAEYLALLKFHGPLTDHECAKRLRIGLSSVNSIRAAVINRAAKKKELPMIVADGTVKVSFGFQRFTYRTKWKIA